ncbi:MAG: hypothetical protein HYX67_15340 [Candidatus Melainabacteria bacterium]|nr:hypothetical protein [Candidatus Melainabacteria bacterium]
MNSNRLVLMSLSVAVLAGLFIPAAQADRVDVSQIPIAADEPIPPIGFPPLPARLDLPIAQGTTRRGYKPFTSSDRTRSGEISPDAFSQPEQAPVTQQQPQQQQPQRRPPDQQPQRKFDQYGLIDPNKADNVEAPKPVTVDQSRTQDLSLPTKDNHDYSGGHAPRRDGAGQQLHDQFITKPIQTIRSRFGIL